MLAVRLGRGHRSAFRGIAYGFMSRDDGEQRSRSAEGRAPDGGTPLNLPSNAPDPEPFFGTAPETYSFPSGLLFLGLLLRGFRLASWRRLAKKGVRAPHVDNLETGSLIMLRCGFLASISVFTTRPM